MQDVKDKLDDCEELLDSTEKFIKKQERMEKMEFYNKVPIKRGKTI